MNTQNSINGEHRFVDDPSLEDDDAVELGEVVLRPDGFHWQSADGRNEFGPFATRDEAQADMLRAAEEGVEPGESLEEAEEELGLSSWVDADTGSLAEGLSTPHLVDDR